MRDAKLAKLEALLAQVQRRRGEPRLVALSNVRPLESANTNVGERAPQAAPRTTPVPLAMPSVEVATVPLEQPARRASSLPPPPPRPTSSTPPRPPDAPGERVRPPSSLVPPAPGSAVEVQGRAPTEVLPVTPVRIAPAPPAAFDAAVRVSSPPRIDQPKSFSELLELSLSLRPR